MKVGTRIIGPGGGLFGVEFYLFKKQGCVDMDQIENCWLVCGEGLGEVGINDQKFAVEMFDKFIHMLEKQDLGNEVICFYTEGVKLVVEDSPVIEGLKLLENLGMKIVICGSCLDYFGLRRQVAVGEVGGMVEIVALLREADKVTRV